MARVKVCPSPGCPRLQPCPVHARPPAASWSKGRDTTAHNRLKRRVLAVRPNRCERCGQLFGPGGKGSQLHHVRPGDRPENVVLLCADCHRAVDAHAR